MKNKVKWLCALLACLLIGTTAAACGNDDHPEYSFPEYGYTNPGETASTRASGARSGGLKAISSPART